MKINLFILPTLIFIKTLTFLVNRFDDYNRSFRNGFNY